MIQTENKTRIVEYGGQEHTVSVEGNIILNPGRFEDEPVEILYWNEALMDGFGDPFYEDDHDYDTDVDDLEGLDLLSEADGESFDIDDNDRKVIKEKFGVDLEPQYTQAILRVSNDGFCSLEYR